MMKTKLGMFTFTFVGYCMVFLSLRSLHVNGRQIIEMIFVGAGVGLFAALAMNPTKRLIESILKR